MEWNGYTKPCLLLEYNILLYYFFSLFVAYKPFGSIKWRYDPNLLSYKEMNFCAVSLVFLLLRVLTVRGSDSWISSYRLPRLQIASILTSQLTINPLVE